MSVELLAPCGSYESFLAAVNAGADAVYLAGNKYGARAYAENFDIEKLCFVIMQAHVRNVKVYLTVNTLVKDTELDELYEYMLPLVKYGLDGVIIQDLGVFRYLKKSFVENGFPNLELHASTQMTITSKYGAAFMKSQGCKRIVPARELSLKEIEVIKKDVDIEIESFIHGAMCYCYSGQCLMSSFIGGRSGNRGRCAQPCRLPYSVDGKEGYYLSLKDMNTLQYLPQLIDAGIDSFKIEGRMKKPEYVAGVVSIYRKYIDLYLENRKNFHIDKKDLQMINNLYIRSETSEGYYMKHHGKDMITFDKPGYNGTEEQYLEALRNRYIKEPEKLPITIDVRCAVGHPISILVLNNDETVCTVRGPVVEESQTRAATKDDVIKQMKKLGNTPFVLKDINVIISGNCFLPVKVLNDLRREMVLELVNTMYEAKKNTVSQVVGSNDNVEKRNGNLSEEREIMSVSVSTMEQLNTILQIKNQITGNIIIDSDLLYDEYSKIRKLLDSEKISNLGVKMPSVIRQKSDAFFKVFTEILLETKPKICYVSNLDGLGFLKDIEYDGMIAGEASLYTWNQQAYDFYRNYVEVLTLPNELNSGEIRTLCERIGENHRLEATLYETAALMTTANCVKLTSGQCDHNRKQKIIITDRVGNYFSVYTNCNHCYNKIYNYLPTSLHDNAWMLKEDGIKRYRLDFTVEDEKETRAVLQTFLELFSSENWKKKVPYAGTFTRGHIKRGVE